MKEGVDSLFPDLQDQLRPVSIQQTGVDPVWTENKAQLVARYLRYFVFITKHGTYIDGFSAPKNPDNPESWAADLVANSEPRFLKDFFLCELEPGRMHHLEGLIANQPAKPKRHFQALNGDFNDLVDDILGSGRIKDKTATFCLIDQYSCECHWQTVRKLAEHKSSGERKIELFYFLATGWLGRSLKGYTRNKDIPNAWWGREDWESLLGQNGDKIAIAMSERFRDELGYRYVSPWPIYKKDRGQGRVMFHMIHASDHPEANKLMKRAYKKVLDVPETLEQLALFED
ncbi:three-Cys-motif partner protein TcmP [Labrenzia sp. ac12]